MAPPTALAPFAEELRFWRKHHHLTQLELAAIAETTTRHLSFLETGKSRPSSEMVERLCEAMGLPIGERNGLFRAAGLAPRYGADDVLDPAVEPFLSAIDALLRQHEPLPGYAFDRYWNVVRATPVAWSLMGTKSPNVVDLLYAGSWRELVANWNDVAWATADRLRHEVADDPRDTRRRRLLGQAMEAIADVSRPTDAGGQLAVCPILRIGDDLVRTVSLTATFGAPRHTATEELRVDLVFPERDVDRQALERLAASVNSQPEATS